MPIPISIKNVNHEISHVANVLNFITDCGHIFIIATPTILVRREYMIRLTYFMTWNPINGWQDVKDDFKHEARNI